METIPPRELEAMARATAAGDVRDVAVGMKLRQFREEWGVTRSFLAKVSRVSYTTILRIENGQRQLTTESLTNLLVAGRKIAKAVGGKPITQFDVWEREFLELVAEVTQEKKFERMERRHAS